MRQRESALPHVLDIADGLQLLRQGRGRSVIQDVDEFHKVGPVVDRLVGFKPIILIVGSLIAAALGQIGV
jgi:hypothetical protein